MSFFSRPLTARTVLSSHKFALTPVRFMSAFKKAYENILASRPEPGVALVTLNRPKALNALNTALFTELNDALRLIDADREIGAIVITGSERAFAGASDPRSSLVSNADFDAVGVMHSWGRHKGDEGQIL